MEEQLLCAESNPEAHTLPPDFRFWVLFPGDNGRGTYLAGSITVDKYIVVPAKQYPVVTRILSLLHRGYSPDRIQTLLAGEGIITDVPAFCHLLQDKGLLGRCTDEPRGRDHEKHRTSLFGHLRALSWEVFSISLEPLHGVLDNIAGWAAPLLIIGALLSTLLVFLWGDFHWSALRKVAYSAYKGHNILWMLGINVMIVPLFVFVHEMAHAVLAARGKVYPKRLSLRWFLTVPYFSLQLPGLYTLPFGLRLTAIAGGPLTDLLIGNLSYLLAVATDASWLWLASVLNYSRFIFNALPILPMTDGYALLSQALFREIDIRGHAGREFRRWRKQKPHNFRGKYVFFYVFNCLIAFLILGSGLWQLSIMIMNQINPTWQALSLPTWTSYVLVIGINILCLYLLRNRLRILLAW